MELMNELFTNTFYLKKLIDIAASKWELQVEEKIYVQENEYLKDGYIVDKKTNMLVFTQHIFCMVMPNKQDITSIHLIHDSQKDTVDCQAYRDQKLLYNYAFYAERDETANEFANYIHLVVGGIAEVNWWI